MGLSRLQSRLLTRAGAICYAAWGVFHVGVAHDIYALGRTQEGLAQGRTFQLAAYMLCIAVTAVAVAALGNWREKRWAFWFNLILIGWADGVWILVVVLPAYVPLFRGLAPPAVFALGAALSIIGRVAGRSAAPAI